MFTQRSYIRLLILFTLILLFSMEQRVLLKGEAMVNMSQVQPVQEPVELPQVVLEERSVKMVEISQEQISIQQSSIIPNAQPLTTNFGDVEVGASKRSTAIVTVTSGTVTTTGRTSPSPPFFVENFPPTPFTKTVGQTYSYDVVFRPTTQGTFSSSFQIFNNAGGATHNLSGRGIVTSSPPEIVPVNFGEVQVNQTARIPTGIQNTGQSSVTITSVTFPSSPFSVEGFPPVPLTVQPGRAIPFTLVFRPVSTGDFAGKFIIQLAPGSSPGAIQFELTGRGVQSQILPTIAVFPAGLDFGSVAVGSISSIKSYNLTWKSLQTPLEVRVPSNFEVAINQTGPFQPGFRLTSTSGGPPPDRTLPIYVRFKPDRGGTFEGVITNSSQNAQTQNVAVRGNSAAPCPTISLSPSVLSEGSVGQIYFQTLTAQGGQLPYIFRVKSGSTPPGTALTPVGVITGIPTREGFYTFIVSVTDADNCESQFEYTIVVRETPPIFVAGIEVTQAIQNLKNEIPLVAEKPTVVRVYLISTTGNPIPNVEGKLVVKRIPLAPVELTSTPSPKITVQETFDRRSLDGSFNFRIPPEFRTAGETEFEFVCDSHKVSGTRIISKKFETIHFNLKIFLDDEKSSDNYYLDALHFLEAALPIPALENGKNLELISSPGKEFFSGLADDILKRVNTIQINYPDAQCANYTDCASYPQCPYFFLAIARQQPIGCSIPFLNCPTGSGHVGSPNPGSECRTCLHGGRSAMAFSSVKEGDSKTTAAHELAHNLGRQHTFTKDEKLDSTCEADLHKPANGTLSPGQNVEDVYYGFNPYTLEVYSPDTYDLMSYQEKRWPSAHTYRGMFDYLKNHSNPPRREESEKTQTSGPTILIGGNILEDGRGSITLITQLASGSAQTGSGSGEYMLRQEDRSGTTLQVFRFTPSRGSEGTDQSFLFKLPFDNRATQISLLRNNTVLDTRRASASPPQISIVSPNAGGILNAATIVFEWTARDNDSDPLTYLVEYSIDAGTTWEILSPEITNTKLEIPSTSILPGSRCMLRVSASDGFNTTVAQSGIFTLVAPMPQVSIEPLGNNNLFVANQSIELRSQIDFVTASSNPSYLWVSDLDGVIGAEQTLFVLASRLREGTHTITFTARKPNGQVGNATTTIRVRRTLPTTDTEAPRVQVLSPRSSEIIQDRRVRVEWLALDNFSILNQDLELSLNGGTTFPIPMVTGLPGQLQGFSYEVLTGLSTDTAQVRVKARDLSGNIGVGVSGLFRIPALDSTAPVVRVIRPNGGEKLKAGVGYTLSWESSDTIGVDSHAILLSTTAGDNYSTTIATGLSGSAQSFTYTIPLNQPKTKTARIRVVARDAAGNIGTDDSDANFKIKR